MRHYLIEKHCITMHLDFFKDLIGERERKEIFFSIFLYSHSCERTNYEKLYENVLQLNIMNYICMCLLYLILYLLKYISVISL